MFLIKKVFQETHIKMKPKILVTRKLSDGAEEKLRKNFDVTLNLKDEPIPNKDLVKMANEYDGFISTGFDKIGEDFFKDLNGKLKIIAQVGVGYDNISVKSAESKKIKVTNTPNVLNEAVAETTILLILAASRRIGEAYNFCLLYTSPSPRDLSTSRMPSSA